MKTETSFMYVDLVRTYLLLFFSIVPPSVAFVRKLISVLESIEKLPVFVYDAPGSSYGLQVHVCCDVGVLSVHM